MGGAIRAFTPVFAGYGDTHPTSRCEPEMMGYAWNEERGKSCTVVAR
jgi:hypothetical protein